MSLRRIFVPLTVLLVGCTLSSYRPLVSVSLQAAQSPNGRPGPDLSSFSCVTFAFDGVGADDQLSTSQLNGMSPSCLGLSGTAYPSVSVAAALSGVSLSVPVGQYTIRIIGFVSPGGSCAGKSAPEIIAADPTAYQIGFLEGVNVSSGASVTVPSSYVAASAIERVFDCAAFNWRGMTTTDEPVGRYQHSAVWTGSKMIVWGGRAYSGTEFDTGGVYDPFSDVWTPVNLAGAPVARHGHSAVWTGSEMIIWGGQSGSTFLDSGGAYNPTSNTWTAVPPLNAPTGRIGHQAVWTGTEMVVWGGLDTVGGFPILGGKYDVGTTTWSPMSTAFAPSGRRQFPMLWTGSQLIFWGGSGASAYNTGGLYDPVGDTWTTMSTTGAPAPSYEHGGVWTGSQLIVWGQNTNVNYEDTGGIYSPLSNTWQPISRYPKQEYTTDFSTVWTGSKMVVWGGTPYNSSSPTADGFYYTPQTDTWSSTSLLNAPSARLAHTAVWTGSKMIVWGGLTYAGAFSESTGGGLYSP